MPPEALPGESEVPGGSAGAKKASEWPQGGSENGRGRQRAVQASVVDVIVKEALAEQPLAQQAYIQAVNAADVAELAYEQADAAVNRADAALEQAITTVYRMRQLARTPRGK